MSEQENMDNLLREFMSATPSPRLSSEFDQRLEKRLHPNRLSSRGRMIMAGYSLFAFIVSICLMRSLSIDWILIAISIALPLTVVAIVQKRQRPLKARRQVLRTL